MALSEPFPATCPVILPQDVAADGSDASASSGRIINVLTTMPTQIVRDIGKNGAPEWSVEAIHGQLALFSLSNFLAQHTLWETHLVAWTGELVDKIRDTDRITAEEISDDPLYLTAQDKAEIEQKIADASPHLKTHPVWLLRRDQLRWRRYPENVLWPVFHYIQGQASDGKAETDAWYDYVRFNEAYANKIRQIYKPGDVVWVHDYYLLLLPQILRMAVPDMKIGMYMHAPFPSSEYFRCIPKRLQLLDGMLGADMIAFQLSLFQRHFISCCARVLGCEVTSPMVLAYGHETLTATLPIGVDVPKVENLIFGPGSTEGTDSIADKVAAVRAAYPNISIIIGRDRLDPVRGIAQKIQAFDMFLQMFPQYRRRVVLIQVLTPGHRDLRSLAKKLAELVNSVNARYGDFSWTPVLHYQMRIDKNEYWALLKVADLAIVTSIRDGMSTLALEFIVAQREHCSPLILSEFSGTASVLKDAILVNPWDAVGVARTIHECLDMPLAQKKSLESKLFAAVKSNTIQLWTDSFLKLLFSQVTKLPLTFYTPALNRPLLLSQFKKAKRRLFLFDYDGTLTPIVKDPAAAIPSLRLYSILDALTADERNQIWIISGRDSAFLNKWFGSRNVGLLAEHGCFMRDIGGKEWMNLAEKFDMSWQQKVEDVFQRYTEHTPGAEIEKKKVALTWHYRRADPELGKFQAEKCLKELRDTIATEYDLEVMTGKCNIEVRPSFLNKGEIVRRLVLLPHGIAQDPLSFVSNKELNTHPDELAEFIMCVGDDVTDEDMFSLLEKIEAKWAKDGRPRNSSGTYGVFTVAVGPALKKTIATSHLNQPSQVLEALGLLAGQVSVFASAGSVELDDRGHMINRDGDK